MPGFPLEYIVIPLVFMFVMLLIVLAAIERWRREKHRLELQKAILERVGTVKDLGEFLTTKQGERFLGSLAPASFRPHPRTRWSVSAGIVLLTVGAFLMASLHAPFFGMPFGRSAPPPLMLAMLLLIAAGIGILLAAAVSFLMARTLGVNGHRSKTDDSV